MKPKINGLEKLVDEQVIAPKNARIARVMADRSVSRSEAEAYVTRTESDRTAFIMKYFHADISDPAHYDLVIDTSRTGINGTVDIISHTYSVWSG
jgi:cytidylate kinase